MKFKDIKAFSDEIDYAHMLAPVDGCWCISEDTMYWFDDNGVYSAETTEGGDRIEDYFIANGDTHQGYWQTFVFPLSKELTYENFEDKHQEFM